MSLARIRPLSIACFMLAAVGIASARDLDKNDPDRANILDAAHHAKDAFPFGEATKFVVLDLIKDGEAAYLCVLREENGEIERTDESTDVYTFGLRKEAGHWSATDLVDGPVGDNPSVLPKANDCKDVSGPMNSAEDIIKAIDKAKTEARSFEAKAAVMEVTRSSSARAVTSNDQAIALVKGAIKRHNLASAKACMDFFVEENGTIYTIDVHEAHSAACGGDPDASPRMFSFEVDRQTGAMKTDALDLADGDMQSIQ